MKLPFINRTSRTETEIVKDNHALKEIASEIMHLEAVEPFTVKRKVSKRSADPKVPCFVCGSATDASRTIEQAGSFKEDRILRVYAFTFNVCQDLKCARVFLKKSGIITDEIARQLDGEDSGPLDGADAGLSGHYCEACDVFGLREELKRCSRCEAAYYCSERCQREHWPSHRSLCTSG
jgi:hypothetical protein